MINQKERLILKEVFSHIGTAKSFSVKGGKYHSFWLGAAVGVVCGAMRDNTVSFKLMERLYDLIFKRLEGHRPLHLLSKRGA
ncbi:MAG: hypothetical protein ACI9LM_000120 [Alteromonadaceae bacterium]|jgi:hypothetical protein